MEHLPGSFSAKKYYLASLAKIVVQQANRRTLILRGMWYFYVLQSTKDSNYFYKGSTNDLRRRFRQHNNGEVISTKPYHPLRLVYYEAYLTEHAARRREAAIKSSGNASVPLLRRIKESLPNTAK